MARASRRLLTIPGSVVLFLVAVATLPATFPIAAGVDMARRSPWALTRSLVFFTWYLLCEVTGIVATFGLWLVARVLHTPRERYLRWHFGLQCWWARALLWGASTVFRMRFEVEGDDNLGAGPVLVFIRHVSVGDTVLPAVFLSACHGLRLRYVMKRELLWDPCLDIVGNRLPNYFVQRGGEDGEREIAEIARLAEGIGPGEGVLIYPEGTRFTEEKRARVLARLEAGENPTLAEHARSLRYVLPPRLGGPLSLLAQQPGADVVFCAHVGFESVTRFSEFLNGGLVGVTHRVAFWRIPAAQIPSDHDARIDWLFDQWKCVDSWIGSRRPCEHGTG
jgi:1-acyl-sn-glycerol-3-phosphate acyltransferase